MEIRKIEVPAKLIIIVEAVDTVEKETIEKALLLAEMEINSKIGIMENDDDEVKVLIRCHIATSK